MNRHRQSTAPPGRIHIIGGRLRGSKLGVPTLPALRPTPQRLRQTLFDWLAPVIEGVRVLDAFAGSGALGIEALSRGARSAVFLERERTQAQAIAADLARLHQDRGEVRCADALQVLAAPAAEQFDIVFADPPFDSGLWTEAAALLEANGWLADDAWVYVEAGVADAWTAPARWRLHRQRDAGAVRGTLFRAGASQA
ncbi:MAG: 16S rRNA (guanine(966)-N(2))-methyltransferase [Rhodanobacteraceae bacterium]|jgi:16S rRNA (guanine966-N2)-methyltransferase|nr:MAG: 16S rRNA (guanine(966)-N(2))-methyltransferase [Rhodanobacteraceae bacterium]